MPLKREWTQREVEEEVETKKHFLDWDGEYIDERRELHDAIVDEQLLGHGSQVSPHLTLTSGGSASGKSDAAAAAMAAVPDCVYVNTDEMRVRLPEFALVEGTDRAGLLQEEAGDIRDQLLAEAVVSRMNIIWDAPGSPSVATRIAEIQDEGYTVTIAYTHRPVAEAKTAAKFRAANAANPADRRVVPDAVLEGSHKKARTGFEMMAGATDREVIVYDKTGKARGEAADVIYRRTSAGDVTVRDADRLDRFASGSEPRIDLAVF